MNYAQILADELGIRASQAQAVIDLIDAGNTIPFIARYRKEAHGSLDDTVLRSLAERLEYLRGLDKRREEILRIIADQDLLTDALKQKIESAKTLAELEDLYRPFRPKRRTRATIAKERGLEPLAMFIRLQPMRGDMLSEAKKYLSGEVPDAESALAGARDILAETISDDADARKSLRALVNRKGVLSSRAAKDEDSIYRLYYAYLEPVSRAQGHRILAINRGEREEFLKVSVSVPDDEAIAILNRAYIRTGSIAEGEMRAACEDAWSRLIAPSLEREARSELTDRANESAIRVFSENLHQLLMTPPIRGHATLGVDPGFRTGCKLAAIDETGKVLETGVGYFTLPNHEKQKPQAKALILSMIRRHGITAIAIGNGTASRESEKFIASLLPEVPGVKYMIVSEAGASVYSASELAAKEFPDYDVSLRSAVSIARRMQDPLAELVKIDPKSIGVGQYQHDLKQNRLTEALDGVVESCVNQVGVEVSTASAALLEHVAGIGPALAKNIVSYREENGIHSRAALKKVPKLGAKAFEQCAGFLRVPRKRQSAGRDRRSSGELFRGEKAARNAFLRFRRAQKRRHSRYFRACKRIRAGRARKSAERRRSNASGHPFRASKARPRPARGPARAGAERIGHGNERSEARHGADGHGAQRGRFRRVCGYRRASGWAGSFIAHGKSLHSPPERGGQGRRCDQGLGRRGR